MPKSLARVLAVEDNPDMGGLIKAALARYRIDTTVVTSGEDALKWLAKESCDLILLDISLPGMNGLDVCARLKSSPRWQQIPVIFVSGHGSAGYRAEARRLGAVDFIEKPFDFLPFITCISGHLKLKPPALKPPGLARTAAKA